ncbi:MAG TPA: hypothetical protein VK892_16645 [Pyrinomonadaceae bacterium]|nr:hypothetical protein [Pyrinomonadaceae bacterium]
MAFSDSSVSLLFKLKAQNDASPEIAKFRKDVVRELDAIDDASKNRLTDFAQSIGLSAEKTAALSKALPIAGAAIAGISALATGAGYALFRLPSKPPITARLYRTRGKKPDWRRKHYQL